MDTYFLFGEMHGTKECPEEFFNFITERKIKKVALEFLKDFQNEVEEFLAEKRSINNITFFKNKEKSHDGRASEAIKSLLKNLKEEKIKLFLVDEEAKSGNERDKLMAKNLSKIKGKVGFLCGNVHAMKKPLQLEKSDELYKYYPNGKVKTCGYFLNKNKKVISIKVHAINGGKIYNFSIQSYQKDKSYSKKFKPKNLPQLIKTKDGENEEFDYIYLIDNFSYSK